jgi:CxxC motif-containing protein (DUF1111 family)
VVALRGVDGDHAQPFRPGFPVWNLWTVQYTPASGSEFRTAPLWGLGQRIFFLHDGRTKDLLEAIRAHVSPSSEAKGVVALFNLLPENQKQDILNFLRAL